jgi:hypothetical protein
MKKQLLILGLTIFTIFSARAQTIENVQATAEGNKVYVNYDLISDIEGQKFTVELRSSINNYTTALKEVSGDVGPDQEAGVGKTIIWNAIAEQGNFTGSVTFEVISTLTFSPLTITNPSAGTNVKIGKPVDIEWKGGDRGRSLKMALLQGDMTVTEVPSVGSAGKYTWPVPKSLSKGENYQIKLFDPTKPNDAAMSAEFQLKKTSILVYVIPGVVVAGVAAALLLGNGGGETPSGCTDVCNPACSNYNPADPSCVVGGDELPTPPPLPGGN